MAIELSSAPWNLGQSHLVGVGILAAMGWAWFGAARRGAPREIVFALLGLGVALAGLMGRLIHLALGPAGSSPQPWWDPFAPGYASFGVLLGGVLAVVPLFAEPRQVRLRVLDVVVPAGLIALAMARFGCLLEGCDFGRATSSSLPWAVRYAAGAPAWQVHLGRGWIEAGSATSALVHPFPLYLASGTLLITLGASRLRLGPGGLAAAAAAGYLAMRLFTELFRDPVTAPMWGGMNLHIGFAVAGGGAVALWWWRDVMARDESP